MHSNSRASNELIEGLESQLITARDRLKNSSRHQTIPEDDRQEEEDDDDRQEEDDDDEDEKEIEPNQSPLMSSKRSTQTKNQKS